MNNSKKICIVIAVKNRIKYTDSFIENFSKSSYTNFTIVVFDDGSTDGTSNFIKEKYKLWIH